MPADAPKRTLAGRLGLDATASVVFVEVPPALDKAGAYISEANAGSF